MDGRGDLATVVRKGHGPRTVVRTMDEDALANRDHGGGARGRSRNGATTRREGSQETSSGKCARVARRHGPTVGKAAPSAVFPALSNAWHPRGPAAQARRPRLKDANREGPPASGR